MLEGLRARLASWITPKGIADLTEEQLAQLRGVPMGSSSFGLASPPRRGTTRLMQSYRQSPWLFAATHRIATAVASNPWELFFIRNGNGRATRSRKIINAGCENRVKLLAKARDQGTLVEIDTHPMLDLIEGGNAFLTGNEVFEVLQVSLDLAGEGFALTTTNAVGAPEMLWPLPPHWVRSTPTIESPWFEVNSRSNAVKIPPEMMFHVKNPDPADPYRRGVGIGDSMSDELDSDEYAAEHIKSFFYNGAMPDALVGFEDAKTPDVDRAEEKWYQKYRGPKKAHRVHFFSKKLKVEKLGHTFEDQQLVELRKFYRESVRQAYGIPPEIMGDVTNSNRATIAGSSFIFAKFTLEPRLEKLRVALQMQIAPRYDDRLIVDFVSPVPEDKAFNLEVMKAQMHAFKRSEWREAGGMESHGDVDEVYMQPLTLFERPVEGEAPAMPTAIGPAAAPAAAAAFGSKSVDRDAVDAVVRSIDEAELQERLVPLWDSELESWGQRELDEVNDEAAEDGKAAAVVTKAETFSTQTPVVADHLAVFGAERVVGVNETTKKAIRTALIAGVEEGEDIGKLSKRVRAVFADANRRRSITISRTEVLRSSNFATHQAHVQSGVVEQRQWVETPDDRLRDEHAALGGQVVGIDKPFNIDGMTALHPGDFGIASMDINCFLPGTMVQGLFVAGVRSWYSGEAVEIKTATGNVLRVTPNHPVMTERGLRPAKDICQGMDLFCDATQRQAPGAGKGQNVHKNPATVEQVFGALADRGPSRRVRVHREELHGDGCSVVGDVDVVGPDRILVDPSSGMLLEVAQKHVLMAPAPGASTLQGLGLPKFDVVADDTTARGLPGSGALPDNIRASRLLPLEPLSFGPASEGHASFLESTHKQGPAQSGSFAQFLERESSEIQLDQVTEVRHFEFSGHVYDLQSPAGWLVAEGICASNCRCTTVAVIADVKDFDQRKQAFEVFSRRVDPWENKAKKKLRSAFRAQEKTTLRVLRSLDL